MFLKYNLISQRKSKMQKYMLNKKKRKKIKEKYVVCFCLPVCRIITSGGFSMVDSWE